MPGVRNVPQVILEIPLSRGGAASLVSATTTSTCQTWTPATGRAASAGSAFTTPRAPTVASARVDILATLPDATAGVSRFLYGESQKRLFEGGRRFIKGLFLHVSGCTCNFLGTERSQCIQREDCVCQRATGQCQCLPNVVGLMCDHCTPNHWNLAGGGGCEACDCDPSNSVTSSCNEVRKNTLPFGLFETNTQNELFLMKR